MLLEFQAVTESTWAVHRDVILDSSTMWEEGRSGAWDCGEVRDVENAETIEGWASLLLTVGFP